MKTINNTSVPTGRQAWHTISRALGHVLRPHLLKTLGIGLGFLSLCLLLIGFSSTEWAMAVAVPHSSTLNVIYQWLNPTVIYTLTSCLTWLLFLWPQRLLFSQFRGKIMVVLVVSCFLLTSAVLGIVEWTLKRGLGRARPITSIEHSIIAARLDGQLSKLEHLEGNAFNCPVGMIVFNLPLPNGPISDDTLLSLIHKQNLVVDSQFTNHLKFIHLRSGIGPYDISLDKKLSLFKSISQWLKIRKDPAFSRWEFWKHGRDCDSTGAAPSGHILRQSFVLYVSLVWALFFWRSLRKFRERPIVRWALPCVNLIALILVGWSRLYGFQHTLSDEMISFAWAVALFGLTSLLMYAAARKASHEVIGLFAQPSGEHLLNTAKIMAMYFDHHQQIGMWNEECERATGYTAKEMKTVDDYLKLYPEQDRVELKQRLLNSFKKGGSPSNLLTVIHTKSNQRKAILWNIRYLEDLLGRVIGKLSVGVEVGGPERKLADIGLGASAVMHDMRSQLTELQIVIEKCQEGSQVEHLRMHLKTLASLVSVLKSRCDDFRDYAKASFFQREEIDLNYVVKFAVMLTRPFAKEHGVRLDIATNGPVPKITGYELLLRHVLITLIRNSVTAYDKTVGVSDKRIVIEVSEVSNAHAYLKVSDSAGGLPTSIVAQLREGRIFEQETNDAQLGLGLILAYIAAKNHGGELLLNAQAHQTQVSLKLPMSITH